MNVQLLNKTSLLATRQRFPDHLPVSSCRTLLAEVCAQASSLLTSAKAEFVRQALVTPATVGVVLETLFSGGGGADDTKSEAGKKRTTRERVAAACRLNSARVMNAVFSEADASDVVR